MNDKPIEIKKDEEEQDVNVHYFDKIVKLIDGSTIIGRMLVFGETNNKGEFVADAEEVELHFHSPMEIWYDYDGNLELHPWVKHSDDIVYTIPLTNIINISTPERMLGIMYANGFVFDGDQYTGFSTDLEVPNITH